MEGPGWMLAPLAPSAWPGDRNTGQGEAGNWAKPLGARLSREVSSGGRMESRTPWSLQAAQAQGDGSCSGLGATTSAALSKARDQGAWPPFPT